MKKALFIDRDGTLIIEPPTDFQVDSLEKLEFYPKVFSWLSRIAQELDYELVMVTNQDGLGTDSYPEETFWPAHNKMLDALKNEGIVFSDELIDKTFEHENKDTRKPGTGMFADYMNGDYDLQNSLVIGDRLTDIELAKNLGSKGILMNTDVDGSALSESVALISTDWQEIYEFLKFEKRKVRIKRDTNETKIDLCLTLDGKGISNIDTGIPFFDHMIDQLSKHGGMDIELSVSGDLEVDEHHTIEDTAIAFGDALKQAVGAKLNMERYGFILPMDDCQAQVAIDFGGRSWLVWEAEFKREKIGDMPTEMFFHFFKSLSDAAACNLNIKAEGKNEHHKIEAIFKGLAKAIKMAVRRDIRNAKMPSTKGVI